MIGLILVGLPVLVLVIGFAVALRVAANRRWKARAEEVRIDREIRVAERHLHNLATQAFGAMLSAARSNKSTRCEGHR